MRISIIIVSYNVRYFLENALASIYKSTGDFEIETIVVDNHSYDDSCQMVKEHYPQVKLVELDQNLGFAKANNLGLNMVSGEYVLFLNPDTIIGGNTLMTCLEFMNQNPDCGACGVKMIDGSGKVLPESKRGFPDPWTSLCKLIGLGHLFPKSKWLNHYYLGELSYDQNQCVEVLSGAFFFSRASLLKEIGGFDESYFMYGEDIDLSTRIRSNSYKLYYIADTKIVHYKGESTKKISFSYLKSFYNAMLIFAENHFNKRSKFWFIPILRTGILLTGFLAWIKNILKQFLPKLIDFSVLLTFVFIAKKIWSNLYYNSDDYFNSEAIWINGVIFSVTWIAFFYYNGIYDKRPLKYKMILSVINGFLLNLILYSLLPEQIRSSRMVLIISFFLVLIYAMLKLWIGRQMNHQKNELVEILLIGSNEDELQIIKILEHSRINFRIISRITIEEFFNLGKGIETVIQALKPDQLIISNAQVSSDSVLQLMSATSDHVEVRIMAPTAKGIVGSPDKNSAGELYTLDFRYQLFDPIMQRQKRLFDFCFSIWVLCFLPILILFQKRKGRWLQNVFNVLSGKKSWVGIPDHLISNNLIKNSKPFVLACLPPEMITSESIFAKEFVQHYAVHYSILMDLNVCLKNLFTMDQ